MTAELLYTGTVGAMVGFILAVAIVYPAYIREAMRARTLERMNADHVERLRAGKSGAFRIIIKACEPGIRR